ncbi:amidohydrolase family protein [Kribbella sp. GL6]|uniref:amidohydrolase family protein n=1 Tax=Kribbella sp. GL6 TaxID=3419765 RepID=UPI003D01D41E
MRLIDCHAHLWDAGRGFPWIRPGSEHYRTFTIDDLERSGEGLELAGTVLVEASRGDRGETLALRELRAERPELVAGYVGNLQVYEDAVPEEFEELMVEARPNGMRLGGAGQVALLPVLEKLGITLDLNLAGALGTAAELAARHEGLTIVVDHLGSPGAVDDWRRELRLAAARPGVMLKVSGLLTQRPEAAELVEEAVEAFGPGRCVVGSDWPICVPRGSRADSLSLSLRGLGGLSDDERAQVLHGNAVRAYRLGREPGEGVVRYR